MLFWFFLMIGRAHFQQSEEYTSGYWKSTLPTIGRTLFQSSEMIYSISGLSLPATVST